MEGIIGVIPLAIYLVHFLPVKQVVHSVINLMFSKQSGMCCVVRNIHNTFNDALICYRIKTIIMHNICSRRSPTTTFTLLQISKHVWKG